MMIELYLDTADVEKVTRFNQCLALKGVTTNPSILAKSGIGLNTLLTDLSLVMDKNAIFYAQVVSVTVDKIIAEARELHALPYNIVVKIPATEIGLSAIKRLKAENIPTLATAIYTAHQGFMAALSGADYLAPYVNRIDAMGYSGLATVSDLQLLLDKNQLSSKILAASFKSVHQATQIMKLGVEAITLPVEIAEQMFSNPVVTLAVDQFTEDWKTTFGEKLSFQS